MVIQRGSWRVRFQSLWRHAGFQRYFANTAWLVAERVLRLAASLFVGVLVARYLGPARFGQISYAQSLVLLCAVLANLGLDGPLTRELVARSKERPLLLGTAMGLKLGGACLLLMLLWVALPATTNSIEDNQLTLIIALGALFQATSVLESHFAAIVRSRQIALAQFGQLLISSAIKLGLIIWTAPLLYFALALLADSVILAVLYFFVGRHGGLQFRQWRFSVRVARSLLHDSWPLILASLAVSLYMRIDQVMLKAMLDSEAVGRFSAAVRISEAWNFIAVAICGSVFPAVVAARQRSAVEYRDRMQGLYDLMTVMGFAVAIPVALLSGQIVQVLYGAPYAGADTVLAVHVLGGPFVFVGMAMHQWILAENMAMKSLLRTFSGAAVNVLMNLWAIPRWGMLGAAMSTLASQMAANVLYDFFDRDVRGQLGLKLRALLLPTAVLRLWRSHFFQGA